MVNKQAIRVGIVGCGYQGQWLARVAAENADIRVVACADPDVNAAKQAAAYGGQPNLYASAEELVVQEDVDAVFIATPHHLLQPLALLAIRAGKHVLAEKPIALNAAQAVQIEAAVAQSGVTFMSGYTFRYIQESIRVQQLLAMGAIGEIEAVSGGIGYSAMSGAWQTDPMAGGGPLLFLGSHLVNHILWYMAGLPVEVYADVRYHPETGIDATSAFQMRFASGATAHCLVTDATDSWFFYLNIFGRSGNICLNFSDFLHYTLTVKIQAVADAVEQKSTTSTLNDEAAIFMNLKAELYEFAEAVAQGRQPSSTAGDGRKVLAVIDAVLASGASGKPVAVVGALG